MLVAMLVAAADANGRDRDEDHPEQSWGVTMSTRYQARPVAAALTLAVTVACTLCVSAASASAARQPDLVVQALSAKQGTAFVGSRLALRARVANPGSGRAPASKVRFYLSHDASWSSADVLLGQASAKGLRPRAKLTASGRVRLPEAAPRIEPLVVLGCADGPLQVAERNEANNCKAARGKLVVVGRTPFEAIDADRRARRIDSERALVLKLFAGFGDPRLPQRYDFPGEETGGSLTAVTGEAVHRFDSLSAKTKALVQPFLIPPAYEGSHASAAARKAPYARGAARGDPVLDGCNVRRPEWNPVEVGVGAGTPAGGAIIWWKASRPGDEAQANRLAGELSSTIWPVLTALMGTAPLSDAAHRCGGSDGRLDIYLEPIRDPVTTPFTASCGPSASDVVLAAGSKRGELAHEFMHVLQMTFPRLSPCTQFQYMDDATATFAEDYVYGRDNTEHQYPELLRFPDARFNHPPTAGYPAWVLFRSVAERVGADVVPAFHTAAQSEPPLDALDSSLPGGIEETWPTFARDGWNQALPPALTESFFNWDDFGILPEVPKVSYALSGRRETYPLSIELRGIGRQYQHLDLSDESAKLVTFVDPGPSDLDPGLRTYAFYRLADGTWKGEDWTGREEVEFCRDTEDVREVVLVHSTSTRPQGPDGSGVVVNTDRPKLRLTDKCDPTATFDAVSASGGFAWSLQEEVNHGFGFSCTGSRSVDWTSRLSGDNPPATFGVGYDMNGENPVYGFSTPPLGIELERTGNGVATEECDGPQPDDDGSVRCDIHVSRPGRLSVGGAQDSPGPTIELHWFFGFPAIDYDPSDDGSGGNGGSCTLGGPRPPVFGEGVHYSSSLFVSSINDGDIANEPVGKTTVPVSTFEQDTVTLTFSGSASRQFSDDQSTGSAEWSWSMTVTFRRR
jgi:hypothetical protein